VIPKKNNRVPRGIIIKSYGNLLRVEKGIEIEKTLLQAIEKEIKKKTANCVLFLFIHAKDQSGYKKFFRSFQVHFGLQMKAYRDK
jgi:hypothetical protein